MRALLRAIASGGVWLLLIAASAERVGAMGEESFGPAGEHVGGSPEWPKGVDEVLRSPSRVYWYWVNGIEVAYYDGDVATVNALLQLYSQIDMTKHQVVVRPGRPSARSFEGKMTPYVVAFEVPGGIVLQHFMPYANTGLFPMAPRLTIHFDAAMAEHLGELKIPENVTLEDAAVRVEDAIAHANDKDSSVRYRAIVALGEADDPTPAGLKALLSASRDENESLRKAGAEGLTKVTAAKEPAEQALRQRLSEFIRSQPQYAQAITPEKLLDALRAADAQYAKGFTARGTMVEPATSGPGKLVAWTVTMSGERLIVDQRDVEDADHPPAPGRFRYTIYSGPERMASIHGYRSWVDGKMSESMPHASFEPFGPTYDLLIGRVLWPLGRGFARRIDRITHVATGSNGVLNVTAESKLDGLVSRWELQIDPDANYLIRSAKAFDGDDAEPSFAVETTGILAGGGRSVAHTARWIEGASGLPVSMAITSVSATADVELIRRSEELIDELRRQGP